MDEMIYGKIRVGDYEYNLSGKLNRKKDTISLKVEAILKDGVDGKTAWETLTVICTLAEEIANEEIVEKYEVE